MRYYKTDKELGELYEEKAGIGFYIAFGIGIIAVIGIILNFTGLIDVFINSFA